jgi:hypothetical protein
MMPTNLPDPPGRKQSRDKLLLVFAGIALVIAFALSVWLWLGRWWSNPLLHTEWYNGDSLLPHRGRIVLHHRQRSFIRRRRLRAVAPPPKGNERHYVCRNNYW